MSTSRPVNLLFALAALLVGSGCATAPGEASDQGLEEPLVRVRQPAGQIVARPGETVDLNLQIDVYNPSSSVITIKRLSLSTLPTSDLQFRQSGRNLDEVIAPNSSRTIELWVRSQNVASRTEPFGPVQVRGTAVFDSEKGEFRKVFIEDIMESSGNWPDVQ